MRNSISYTHENIFLDGEVFRGCDFRDCRLIYSGGTPPMFDNCRFDNCEWKLEGGAAQTLVHLRGVWKAGGKVPVQSIIKEITGS